MILQGQSPEDTQKNLASRIKEAYQETAG
jgi:hypothetical protein